jgi:hypothetical protein
VGGVVTVVQFVVVKSEFSCSTKLVEGTIQESTRFVFARAMLNEGVGVDCNVQTPPPLATATSFLPSAEDARCAQSIAGALVCIHVRPESIELVMAPPSNAAHSVPSAEEATRWALMLVVVQVAPQFVEVTTV